MHMPRMYMGEYAGSGLSAVDWTRARWYTPSEDGHAMLCQKCHKNLASVRYAEVVDGEVTEQHLCAECMAAIRDKEDKGFKLSGTLPTVHWPDDEDLVQHTLNAHRTCRLCGAVLGEVLEQARAGCARCYESFWRDIEPRLAQLQPDVAYRGKPLRVDDLRARLRDDLQTKRMLLRNALSTEDYEEAAHLRDEIRGLEAGLSASESGAD